jgi:hypothetical protein
MRTPGTASGWCSSGAIHPAGRVNRGDLMSAVYGWIAAAALTSSLGDVDRTAADTIATAMGTMTVTLTADPARACGEP